MVTSWSIGEVEVEDEPRAGKSAELSNPISGERYVFREGAGGEALCWETYIIEPGAGPPEHLHPRQEERFLVRTGAMGARLGRQSLVLREGEELVVPPGLSHKVWNAGEGELRASVEMRPAQPSARFREFLQAGSALGPGGRLLSALEGARLVHEYRDVIRPASPTAPVQRVVFPLLAVLAKMARGSGRRGVRRVRWQVARLGNTLAFAPVRTYQLTASRRLVNRTMTVALRFGVGPKRTYLLTVKGRKSGEPHTTPVTLVEEDGGRRWLVAPYGEVNWVKNARAAGTVTLTRGRRSETVPVVELGSEESAPVLKRYAERVPITRPYFVAVPDAPVEAFAVEAERHPVFRIG
jgi:deazaflavin-dependent oxidoreductase (nitroreductase family)